MAETTKYISQADVAKIEGFLRHYAARFFLVPDGPLYHYTTGDSLIKILQSGELWSTQAACLNDTTELIYATEELHKRVKARLSVSRDPKVITMLKRLDEALISPNAETSPIFVTCFSERRDDLSQWRAYSSGEGGYAIQFDPVKLRDAGSAAQILLVRVEYEPTNHSIMFDDVIVWSERYFLELDGAKEAPSTEAWADEFVSFWLEQLAFFAPCIKNPKFKEEQEWRLIYYFRPDDPTKLKFRQRQSMMTRHIPLRLAKPLPITGVVVGPCRHPTLSKIAIGDLLLAAGYDSTVAAVELTAVPYRTA